MLPTEAFKYAWETCFNTFNSYIAKIAIKLLGDAVISLLSYKK